MDDSALPDLDGGTRDRLIGAMIGALSTRGLHGVGISEVLAAARAPKGVLYHHFPGGKTELAVASVRVVAQRATGELDRLLARHRDPVQALEAWIAESGRALLDSGYERGCPLATIALESTARDTGIRAALAQAFAAIRARLEGALLAAGCTPQRAAGLAALLVAAYEGALIQARVAGSAKPLQDACSTLLDLLRDGLPAGRSGGPAPHA